MIVFLPWPPAILSPNRTGHWKKKADARKKSKADAYYIALSSPRPAIGAGNIPLKITFHPPGRRRHDADNLLSASKGMLDGLALAWGVDDVRFRPVTIDFGDIVKNGSTAVEIDDPEQQMKSQD